MKKSIKNWKRDNRINAQLILNYIKENKLTKRKFCKQCNISLYSFYKIIHDKNFNILYLFRVAKRLGIHVCEFFKSPEK